MIDFLFGACPWWCKTDSLSMWVNQLMARRGAAKTYVAMAARMARLAWILMNRNELYRTL